MGTNTQKVIPSLQLNFLHQMRPHSSAKSIQDRFILALRYLGHRGYLTILRPDTQSHKQAYTEINSNSKSLTPYFAYDKALIKCKDHARVMLYLFYGI